MEAGDIPGAVRLFESAVQREPDNQLVCPIVYLALKLTDEDLSSLPISHSPSSSAYEMLLFLLCPRPGSIWERAKQKTNKSLQLSVPSAGQ